MRWKGRQESQNVEDVRSQSGKAGMVVGGGFVTIILAIIIFLMGGNPMALLQNAGPAAGDGGQVAADPERDRAEEPLAQFSKVVLKDTEDVWNKIFADDLKKQYNPATLKLFRDSIDGACGRGTAASGPFYCPLDRKVYLDLSFFAELQQRFKAPGDFAMAYVIAHEVAHHVQNELGISNVIQQLQAEAKQNGDDKLSNELSVRLELQADYLAGVWVHHNEKMNGILEKGDIEEALHAATRIGDNVLQHQATGRENPDAFTHGTDQQRYRWLRAGIESGSVLEEDMQKIFNLDYEDL